MKYFFSLFSFFLITSFGCKNADSKNIDSIPNEAIIKDSVAHFIVQVPRASMLLLNYMDNHCLHNLIRIGNPGGKDTLLLRTAKLTSPTLFYFSKGTQPDVPDWKRWKFFLVKPGDTVRLKLLKNQDAIFTDSLGGLQFLNDFIDFDYDQEPRFALLKRNKKYRELLPIMDSINGKHLSDIKKAYNAKELSKENYEFLLQFILLSRWNLIMVCYFDNLKNKKNDLNKQTEEAVSNFEKIIPSIQNSNFGYWWLLFQNYLRYKTNQAFEEEKNDLDAGQLGYMRTLLPEKIATALIFRRIVKSKNKNNDALRSVLLEIGKINGRYEDRKMADSIYARYYSYNKGKSEAAKYVMENMEGEKTDFQSVLSKHRGKVTFVDFWASWCGPCREQMPVLDTIKEKYKGAPVAFLAVSIDKNEEEHLESWKIASRAENLADNISYRLIDGHQNPLLERYSFSSVPRYMIFGKEGQLISDNFYKPTDKEFEAALNKILKQQEPVRK